MISRRATTTRNSSDITDPNSDHNAVASIDNNTTPPAPPAAGLAMKHRRRKVKASKSKKTLKSWIPLCFVAVYILVVFAALSLLARYLVVKNPNSITNKASTNAKEDSNKPNWIYSHLHRQLPPKQVQHVPEGILMGDMSGNYDANNPTHLEFPKIIRNSNDYPSLSKEALEMCTRALWHTIETTTIVLPDKETFIHTGDIDDLWLRDSAAQIHPMLVPMFGPNRTQSLIQLDPKLDRIVSGLIKRTAQYIRHDPYANAFRIDDSYVFNAAQKAMGRHDLISTWNYELDSFAYWMRMVYFYWKQSPNGNSPDNIVFQVQNAADEMVDLWIAEQKHELDEVPRGPLFDCVNCNKPYRYPGLPRNGKGSPTNASSGLTWTGFRPSDDECTYGFLIPANMFAVVALAYIEEMATVIWNNPSLATKARKLQQEIQTGIETHGIVAHPVHGKIYAYEVDGLGSSLLMDDANVPSLLSIPYLGYKHYNPEVYANTRRFIFSNDNPMYQKGTNDMTGEIEGYGSPHMQAAIRHNIWPMSIAVQGLTR